MNTSCRRPFLHPSRGECQPLSWWCRGTAGVNQIGRLALSGGSRLNSGDCGGTTGSRALPDPARALASGRPRGAGGRVGKADSSCLASLARRNDKGFGWVYAKTKRGGMRRPVLFKRLAVLRGAEAPLFHKFLYVPSLHPARYSSCSGVSRSILIPMDSSFSLATRLSSSSGTL